MNRKAFTLIELVMTIVISSLIFGIFAMVIYSGMQIWFFNKIQKTYLYEARTALNRMVREIRMTRDTTSAGITTFATSEYSFTDINGNAINYRQSGSSLLRNSDIMIDNLVNPGGLAFAYLNQTGVATTERSSIRAVKVNLFLRSGSNVVKMQSAGGIRNR